MAGLGYTYSGAFNRWIDSRRTGESDRGSRRPRSAEPHGFRCSTAFAISAARVLLRPPSLPSTPRLYDLKARLLDLPLAKLLGSYRNSVPIYGSGGFTSYSDDELASQLSWLGV